MIRIFRSFLSSYGGVSNYFLLRLRKIKTTVAISVINVQYVPKSFIKFVSDTNDPYFLWLMSQKNSIHRQFPRLSIAGVMVEIFRILLTEYREKVAVDV